MLAESVTILVVILVIGAFVELSELSVEFSFDSFVPDELDEIVFRVALDAYRVESFAVVFSLAKLIVTFFVYIFVVLFLLSRRKVVLEGRLGMSVVTILFVRSLLVVRVAFPVLIVAFPVLIVTLVAAFLNESVVFICLVVLPDVTFETEFDKVLVVASDVLDDVPAELEVDALRVVFCISARRFA